MSRFARVTSIDVLQTTAIALHKFRGEAAAAIDDLNAEIRRALEWIHHDRKEYWTQQLRRSNEQMAEARLQWQQARVSRRIEGHEPACIDEQRAFEKAKRRVEMVDEKVRAVQHWQRAIEQAIDELQPSRTQFTIWLDSDLPKAVAALNRMSESLGNYVSLGTPEDAGIPTKPSEGKADDGDDPNKAAS